MDNQRGEAAHSCSCDIELDENFPSKITLAGTPSAAATARGTRQYQCIGSSQTCVFESFGFLLWSLIVRMRSTRSERASGGRTPGTTVWRSGLCSRGVLCERVHLGWGFARWFSHQVNSCGGIGGGTCVTPPEAAGRSRPVWSVVCIRLIICINLAVVAKFCAWAVSSSDADDACTARLSESKKRLLIRVRVGVGVRVRVTTTLTQTLGPNFGCQHCASLVASRATAARAQPRLAARAPRATR